MVGGEGSGGGTPDQLGTGGASTGVRAAYEIAAAQWETGPAQVYGILARALVACAGVPVAGRCVLDLGAGTGAAGRAALGAGAARVVAADLACGMLRQCEPPLCPVAADAAALPFASLSFDLVLAAFSLSHLHSISAGLAQARRVGRAIAVSAFAPGWAHPAKPAVDTVLRTFGYQPPAWYVHFKAQSEPQAEDRAVLMDAAAQAGFTQVGVRDIDVPTGLSTPAQLASWRLGMAHIAPFLAALDPARRAAACHAAELAVAGSGPLVVRMRVLTAS